jgi:hypothetical protein
MTAPLTPALRRALEHIRDGIPGPGDFTCRQLAAQGFVALDERPTAYGWYITPAALALLAALLSSMKEDGNHE